MQQNDANVAAIARRLVIHFRDFAYTRKEEDRKAMLAAQVELIQAVKAEEEAPDVQT